MKKKYAIFTVIIFILLVTIFTYFSTLKQNNIYKEESIKSTKITKGISMMLEQNSGAGDYKLVTQSGWPTDGYILNTELSRCENGSTLNWDDTKKVVIVSGNLSDKCYVYFDKVVKATINEMITSDVTDTSITITINATKGTYDISKYYYSVDNGVTWNESANNKIVISNLTQDTKYTLKVYVQDVKGLNSEVKSITATTIKLISFTINDTEYKAIEGMTWGEWVDSKYNVEDAYGISGAGYVVFKVASGGFYYFDSFNKKDELIIENGKYTHNTSGMPEIE